MRALLVAHCVLLFACGGSPDRSAPVKVEGRYAASPCVDPQTSSFADGDHGIPGYVAAAPGWSGTTTRCGSADGKVVFGIARLGGVSARDEDHLYEQFVATLGEYGGREGGTADRSASTLGGRSAVQQDHEIFVPRPVRRRMRIVVKDGQAYVALATTSPEVFSEHETEINAWLDSVTFDDFK